MDLKGTFHEVASGSEAQAKSVVEINESLVDSNNAVKNVTTYTNSVKDVADKTLDDTAKGHMLMQGLLGEMNDVHTPLFLLFQK